MSTRIRRAAAWPFRQVAGGVRRFWRFLTDRLTAGDVVPPWIRESLAWFSNQFHKAAGWGTPGEQLTASAVLAVATFFTGFVTGGLAWAFIIVWVVTAGVGLVRFVPIVDELWPLGTEPPGVLEVGERM